MTIADMVADARRHSYGSMTDQINLVLNPYTANDSELSLELDVTGITAGMVISSGLNVWYVKGTNAASNTVYVIPGYDNSPSENATQGQMVFIKPRVTDWFLFNVINDEIVKLSAPDVGLYKIAMWESTVDPTWQTYGIPAEAFGMTGLMRIRYRAPGSPDTWLDLPDKAYRVQFNTDDGDSFIRILRNVPSGSDLQFVYKAPFTVATSLADDPVVDCGLAETMVDIPPLGAQVTLARTTEMRRNQVQTQGDARRAAEVVSGSNRVIAASLEQEYQSRVNQELTRLLQRNPYLRSM